MKTTAFLGLGAMGWPMAAHLTRHASDKGQVFVWNRTSEKAVAHAQMYGSQAVSLREVGQADVIFSCLPTSTEVDEVMEKMFESLRPGTIWIDCTSGHPEAARRQAKELQQQGIIFFDAPVSGGTSGAEAGTLTVMVGGDEKVLASIRPVFAFADRVIHVGKTGAGFAVKAVNNALLAVNLWAAGEGLCALTRFGVESGAALEVINASSGRSNATENLIGQRVLTRTFPVTFTLGLLAKDIGIATDTAQEARASTPLLMQIEALYRGAVNAIGAEEDHTAALKMVEYLNDVILM